jgi:hypothetical protein
MTKPTCKHCGHALPAAQIRAIVQDYHRKLTSSGGMAAAAKVDTKKRAKAGAEARWKDHVPKTRTKKKEVV